MKHLNALCAAVGAALLAGASTAHPAPDASQKVTYWSKDLVVTLAYVITWDTTAHRAHFAETFGNFDGSYVDDGNQRVFTLDTPLVLPFTTQDCNGNDMTANDVTTQLVIRDVSGDADHGEAAVVPIGYVQDVGGCTPGRSVPFGTPTDAGIALLRQAFATRPAVDELGPGAQVAGLSESAAGALGDPSALAAQVVTLERDHVRFEGSGHRFPSTLTPDGWLVIDFGKFKRGYTRVRHDRETDGEIWFGAEWVDGAPASIELTPAVAPTRDAGFGDLADSARRWSDGMFQIYAPTNFDLYHDHTGTQVVTPGEAGLPASQSALTWTRDGAALSVSHTDGGSTVVHAWRPVANHGRTHFVIESEELYADGVDVGPAFAPRINWLVDEGKAVKGR